MSTDQRKQLEDILTGSGWSHRSGNNEVDWWVHPTVCKEGGSFFGALVLEFNYRTHKRSPTGLEKEVARLKEELEGTRKALMERNAKAECKWNEKDDTIETVRRVPRYLQASQDLESRINILEANCADMVFCMREYGMLTLPEERDTEKGSPAFRLRDSIRDKLGDVEGAVSLLSNRLDAFQKETKRIQSHTVSRLHDLEGQDTRSILRMIRKAIEELEDWEDES